MIDEVEDSLLVEIKSIPEPKLKIVFKKHEHQLHRKKNLTDEETKVEVDIQPDRQLAKKYIIERPYQKKVGKHTSYSHSECNTDEKEMTSSHMKHTEGGWPKDVKTELLEHKNKFIRKTLKEDMFLYTTVKLGIMMENTLKQNNTFDIEGMYFDDVEPEEDIHKEKFISMAKFKDFSGYRRPVSSLSWQSLGGASSLAIAYCSPDFLGNYCEPCTDCYIADFENTTAAKNTFTPPTQVTVIEYNDKHKNLLGGGCLSGQVTRVEIYCISRLSFQVCWFDDRTGQFPVGETEFDGSHSDAVYTFRWIGKTGTEFFTGSEDGYMKWWDIRNIKKATREFLVVVDEDETDPEKAEGVNSLSFESTIPSKFMIGTDKGKIISCRMQPKQGTTSMVLSAFDDLTTSKVMAVDRNPFFPKYFLVVKDNSAKIWCEDLKTSSIMWMKPSPARLTAGSWSPARMSVFLTTRYDGVLELWDFLYRQDAPFLPIKVADYPLLTLKVLLTTQYN